METSEIYFEMTVQYADSELTKKKLKCCVTKDVKINARSEQTSNVVLRG
jgi:hypothetical protein